MNQLPAFPDDPSVYAAYRKLSDALPVDVDRDELIAAFLIACRDYYSARPSQPGEGS